jgi:CMP-N,N'-diacetyllegionaminic acid synthase|tara:strand:- start:242 stop:916 length:675 start_codon:yes stop_codon:yes gene_type:complete
MKKKVIAIVLARGGSKSIKNKNLKKINNKPLLEWTINNCKKSKLIHQTWLSSDSQKILNYGIKNKINVIKRPAQFATDKASSESAWLHAIKFLENKKINFDTVIAPQPTSPIRGKNDFDEAIKKFFTKKYDTLFSSSIIKDFFVWKKNGKKLSPNYNYRNRKPRQSIDPLFLENGSFFIFNKSKFKKFKSRMFGYIGTYIQENYKSYQIDEPDDIFIIESLMKK